MESQTQRRCAYDARNHSKNRKSKRRFGRRADFEPLLGRNADKTVADQFAAAVAALGASPVVLRRRGPSTGEIFAGAKESCFDERYFGLFSKFDAGLDVFACQPIVLGYELEDAQMDLCGYAAGRENGEGTFHIAVGANTMFGGEKPGDGPWRLRRPRRSGGAGPGHDTALARQTGINPCPVRSPGRGLVIAADIRDVERLGQKTLPFHVILHRFKVRGGADTAAALRPGTGHERGRPVRTADDDVMQAALFLCASGGMGIRAWADLQRPVAHIAVADPDVLAWRRGRACSAWR